MGNLTRDPALKYLPSQTSVTEFGIAINSKYKTKDGEEREEVTFIDCSAFGKTGELVNQYYTKGKPIMIEGRLKLQQWEDKNGGGKRSKHVVMVEQIIFLPRSDGGQREPDEDRGEPARQAPPKQAARPPQRLAAKPPAEQPFGEEQQFKEDDIPF